MFRILSVEDSDEGQLVIKKALARPDMEVVTTRGLRETYRLLEPSPAPQFHLILLDLGLEDGDGIELLDFLQSHETFRGIPVFLLTVRNELTSKVSAFSLGAEDYLVKPISPIELKARVEMKLKKLTIQKQKEKLLRKGDLVLDTNVMKAALKRNEKLDWIELTGKEFKILYFLARHEGRAYNRAQIVKSVWGESVHVLDRTVDSHICNLRKKLGELGHYIESLPRAGYRFHVHQLQNPHSSQTL